MIPVALVTGASRGLGRGIALELARAGWSVGINFAGNAAEAQTCAGLCRAAARDPAQRFVPLQGDIGQPAQRQALLESHLQTFGRIDSLVNNAGVAPVVRADLVDAGEESFDRLIAINTKGPYFLTQLVARYWLVHRPAPASRYHSVVFCTSISVHTASTQRGDYCISKAGVAMAAQLWAARLAPEGIMVYEVRPGIMKTDMTAGVTSKYDTLIAQGLVPQNRWGTGEDVGLAVKALVTGDFPFSSGTVIDVDGGFQMRRL
ncbi:MAG TPA: 3-ketoacyl-ACP reductase [Rubrivivax sp.]|nr:3-ketoacyl-ACP reductase [Rubrivivax sp.]